MDGIIGFDCFHDRIVSSITGIVFYIDIIGFFEKIGEIEETKLYKNMLGDKLIISIERMNETILRESYEKRYFFKL